MNSLLRVRAGDEEEEDNATIGREVRGTQWREGGALDRDLKHIGFHFKGEGSLLRCGGNDKVHRGEVTAVAIGE